MDTLVTVVPRSGGQDGTLAYLAMDIFRYPGVCVLGKGSCYPGVVYRHIRFGNLSFKFIYSIFNTKNYPAMDFDDDIGPELPTRANEEFRPFIRRLPEFKFWYSVSKSTLIALGCTFFECFNIPVFWPILVMYFITLFCITMKRQIKHMIKYRYIPFTHGKPKYQGHEDTGKVVIGAPK